MRWAVRTSRTNRNNKWSDSSSHLPVGDGSIELLSVRVICCSNYSSDQHDGLDLLFIGEESNNRERERLTRYRVTQLFNKVTGGDKCRGINLTSSGEGDRWRALGDREGAFNVVQTYLFVMMGSSFDLISWPCIDQSGRRNEHRWQVWLKSSREAKTTCFQSIYEEKLITEEINMLRDVRWKVLRWLMHDCFFSS